jgi:hypothetical protein
MNVTRCEASHGGTGGECAPWGSPRRCFDGRQRAQRQGFWARHVFAHAVTSRRLHSRLRPFAFNRRREPGLVDDLVGALLAHAEELGDLN